MPWSNPDLVVFHGCDLTAANAIATRQPKRPNSIDLAKCALLTDFGCGFYTTTSRKQAENWANQRCRRLRRRRSRPAGSVTAAVLTFTVERHKLAQLQDLVFVLEGSSSDFWDLIRHCRAGSGHNRSPNSTPYDAVFGPVTLWPQTLVAKDCDQISFHDDHATALLGFPSVDFAKNPNRLF